MKNQENFSAVILNMSRVFSRINPIQNFKISKFGTHFPRKKN